MPSSSIRAWLALAICLALAGCAASSTKVPVGGKVTLDDQPLADAVVNFYPGEGTPGLGGFGRTGADGKYTVTPARGGAGLDPGAYAVTVSLLLRKDGTPPPPDLPPIESDATERLPAMYSSREASTLKATVSKDTKSYDFDLRKKR